MRIRPQLRISLALLLLAASGVEATGRAPASALGASSGGERIERELYLMGTRLTVTAEAAELTAARAAAEAAVRALEAAEARLSTWTGASELVRVNRSPAGEAVAVSPRLAAELAAAVACAEATGGAFDPLVGPLVEAWQLRRGGAVPEADVREEARRRVADSRLAVTAEPPRVTRHGSATVEEGGFGKGAGLDRALTAAAAEPGAVRLLLDLGGQVAGLVESGSRAATPFTITVADPRDRGRPVAEVSFTGGSLATSGNSERGLVAGDAAVGHLLDPRTGRPAPDFGSLTVWAESALAADCLSTGLYVLGPERALAWAAARPGVEVLVLEPRPDRAGGLAARATPGWGERLRALAPGLEIVVEDEKDPMRTQSGGRTAALSGAGEEPRR